MEAMFHKTKPKDGDVFKIIVPLDDTYSFDAKTGQPQTANRKPQTATIAVRIAG